MSVVVYNNEKGCNVLYEQLTFIEVLDRGVRCTAASVSGLTLDYYHHESFSQVTTSDNCDLAGLY